MIYGLNPNAKGLLHLMLITLLCKQVRVVWTLNEEILPPKKIMDNNLVYYVHDNDDVLFVGEVPLEPRLQEAFFELESIGLITML